MDATDEVSGSAPTAVEGTPRKGPRERRPTSSLTATRLGRYIILHPLGSGGMGAVYAAYDPELNRRVALKVMKSVTASAEGQARLVREAQALARVAHPNVVAVFDVGEVDQHVFVAMELVEGVTLGAWLRAKPRSWREILEAFVAAGRGVVAAHAAGVVHRDFKPGNVLVGNDDRVRVMDFGLARAGASSGEESPTPSEVSGSERDALSEELTVTGSILGTPLYMPPEAFRGEITDETGDQFSFCVALYHALYGALPFAVDLDPKDDKRWTVREPPRKARIPKWLRAAVVRGLAPTPSARYPSMAALVDAIGRDPSRRRRRLLAVALVMFAGAGVIGYKRVDHIRKVAACERDGESITDVWNPARASQIAAAFSATGIAYASDTWQRSRDRFERYASQWNHVRTSVCMQVDVDGTLSESLAMASRTCLDRQRTTFAALLDQLSTPDATKVQRTAKVSANLALPALCVDDTRRRHWIAPPAGLEQRVTAVDAELARASAAYATAQFKDALANAQRARDEAKRLAWAPGLAEAKLWVGRAQEALGQYDDARTSLEESFLEAGAAGRDEIAVSAASRVVNVVGFYLAKPDQAVLWGQLAQMFVDRLGSTEDLGVAELLTNLANARMKAGDHVKAIALHERALAIREHLLGPDHPDVAASLTNLAIEWQERADYAKAHQLYERAQRIYEAAYGPDHPSVVVVIYNIGILDELTGEYKKALNTLTKVLAIREKTLGPEHPEVADSLQMLANVHDDLGEYTKSIALNERALAIREKRLGPDHPSVGDSLDLLGVGHYNLGEYDKALALYERSQAIREKALGSDHIMVGYSLNNVGLVWVALKQPDKAIAIYERARGIFEKALGAKHPNVAAVLTNLGSIYEDRGDHPKAIALFERALAIRLEALGPDHAEVGAVLDHLGRSRAAKGEHAKGVELVERGLAVREKALGPEHPSTIRSRFHLAGVLWGGTAADHARALTLASAARDFFHAHGPKDDLDDVNKWLASHRRR